VGGWGGGKNKEYKQTNNVNYY